MAVTSGHTVTDFGPNRFYFTLSAAQIVSASSVNRVCLAHELVAHLEAQKLLSPYLFGVPPAQKTAASAAAAALPALY